jgi:hypothetical protein
MNAYSVSAGALLIVLVLAGVIFMGCGHLGARESGAGKVKWVYLQKYEFPNPADIRGILLYDLYRPDDPPAKPDVYMLIGDRKEIEGILKQELNPEIIVPDRGVVAEISALYAAALEDSRKANAYVGAPPYTKIVFITKDGGYVRQFAALDDEKVFRDKWMESPELWQVLHRIGFVWSPYPADMDSGPLPPIK